jgi:hypothetical protein
MYLKTDLLGIAICSDRRGRVRLGNLEWVLCYLNLLLGDVLAHIQTLRNKHTEHFLKGIMKIGHHQNFMVLIF